MAEHVLITGAGGLVGRSALVIGMSATSSLSFIAAVGVYAAVLKARGLPLAYPGGAGYALADASSP